MNTVMIVVLVLLGLLLLVVIAGATLASRRNRAGAGSFADSLLAVDRQLAAATAEDHGWERATLDTAAVEAFREHRPGIVPTAFELLQIVDEPGTESDLAIFRVIAPEAVTHLTLGRRDGAWYAKRVVDED